MRFYMAASKAGEKTKTPIIGYFKIYLKSENFS